MLALILAAKNTIHSQVVIAVSDMFLTLVYSKSLSICLVHTQELP